MRTARIQPVLLPNQDILSRIDPAATLHDASERSAPVEPFRPGPEPGQRPTAPRAAASRPPAVVPLPSSRADAGFGRATPEVGPTASRRARAATLHGRFRKKRAG